ncbi:MAG TPA: YciI family protein [Dokdonella sp.]|jgi:uncharacterized protein YciI|nr:YciI family protein [Dokdonella sp.]
MFLIVLTYTKPLDVVDRHLEAHRAFLSRGYEAGVFLLSGRREPRQGGIILAASDSEENLRALLATDPFQVHEVASYALIRFTPTMAATALEPLLGS